MAAVVRTSPAIVAAEGACSTDGRGPGHDTGDGAARCKGAGLQHRRVAQAAWHLMHRLPWCLSDLHMSWLQNSHTADAHLQAHFDGQAPLGVRYKAHPAGHGLCNAVRHLQQEACALSHLERG